MRSIGEIRQQRLLQFVTQTGLSYADINSGLGRNRRDATLNQVAKGAKNTSSGKPRRMGDSQARLLETTFGLPDGWFDSDPEKSPDLIARKPTGQIKIIPLPPDLVVKPHSVREDVAVYNAGGWPFKSVPRDAIAKLTLAEMATLERVMLAVINAAPPADWLQPARAMAAELDKGQPEPNFTLFVRALETKLEQLGQAPKLLSDQHAERRN